MRFVAVCFNKNGVMLAQIIESGAQIELLGLAVS